MRTLRTDFPRVGQVFDRTFYPRKYHPVGTNFLGTCDGSPDTFSAYDTGIELFIDRKTENSGLVSYGDRPWIFYGIRRIYTNNRSRYITDTI